jgi:hypothetical protein
MRCFLLAIAKGSAVDTTDNNLSLFATIEQMGVPVFPANPGVELWAAFEVSDADRETLHEVRLVIFKSNDEDGYGLGERRSTSDPVAFTPLSRRFRVRFTGLSLGAPGKFHIQVEWRRTGEADWNLEAIAWPLQVDERVSVPPDGPMVPTGPIV